MIDLFTVNVIVAVVTITAGVLYLVETILRREVGAGRVWALAFLGGMLTVVAYLVWQQASEPWIAIAIGNASLVATSGCFWLGCRTFNGRATRLPGAAVASVAVVTMLSALLAGPRGGEWAGSELMFLGIAVFAALGSFESRRGAMGAMWSSLGFTIVLAFVAVFYFARAVVLAVLGPDSDLFRTWLNSSITGIVSIVLTLVALTTATMLRSGRVTVRQDHDGNLLRVSPEGILEETSFRAAVPAVAARSEAAGRIFAVVAMRMDDLAQISLAFGSTEEEALRTQFRAGVRRFAPTFALVGHGADNSMVLAFEPDSAAEAGRVASRIQRRLLDGFAERGSAVIPVLGVGVAVSLDMGYDAVVLQDAASLAARRSSVSVDASVIFAEPSGDLAGGDTAIAGE